VTRAALLLALGLLPGLLPQAAPRSEVPKLAILSRFGVGEDVKLYNGEAATFFARREEDARARLLRDVEFLLYKEGGRPDRPSDLVAKTEDSSRWGRPPSSFSLPLAERELPVGNYRLRAVKKGHVPAEIRVVTATLRYFDLETVHRKDRYLARFFFRLQDRSELRDAVTLSVRVESESGALLDSTERTLRRSLTRRDCFETSDPVRISSLAKKPKPGEPAAPGRPLILRPGCRLVVVVDRRRISWPVPLPPEPKRGNSCDPADEIDPSKRGGSGRGR